MRLCLPANNPWAVRRLKAPENVEVNVKMASPPNIVTPAGRLALPPNHVAATVKMVNPPSRAAVIAKKANPPKHVMVIGESPPNKMVEAVRARSHGLIPRSNGADGPWEVPRKKDFLRMIRAAPVMFANFRVFFSRPAPSPQSVGGGGGGGAARGGKSAEFFNTQPGRSHILPPANLYVFLRPPLPPLAMRSFLASCFLGGIRWKGASLKPAGEENDVSGGDARRKGLRGE